MYELYIGNKNYSSWSLRPWVLLMERGIPFTEKLVPFESGSGASWTKFRAFSPTGKVPCLKDGDTVVWDSLGIAEYLAERHPGIWPKEPAARTFARCATCEMHAGFPTLRASCSMNCGVRVQIKEPSDALLRELARLSELWTEGLRRFGGPFLAGAEFGAVDAFYAPVAFRIQSYQLKLSEEAMEYAKRLLLLPSMKAWYEAALIEPYRDEDHEAEVRTAGTLVKDYRR